MLPLFVVAIYLILIFYQYLNTFDLGRGFIVFATIMSPETIMDNVHNIHVFGKLKPCQTGPTTSL